jgi:hypothetical protein
MIRSVILSEGFPKSLLYRNELIFGLAPVVTPISLAAVPVLL